MPRKKNVAQVFVSKSSEARPGPNICNLLARTEKKGDIGIEIEVEGNKFPKDTSNSQLALIPKEWKYTKDGSLRGQDNAEYVLREPIKFEEVPGAVTELWDMFSKYGSVLDESNRTSVHVHLNVGRWHLNRLTSFLAMYFAVEEILTEWCGEHRVGNLFCLRAKDAPAIVTTLKRFIQQDGAVELPSSLHYAGLNANAIMKFGSLEIRSLRGCTDPQHILDWVAVLERIYNLSADFADPRALVDSFSGNGPLAFYDMILGDRGPVVKESITWDNQRIMESMYDGIRLAQDLCYCRDWSLYRPVEIQRDPFGRRKKVTSMPLLEPVAMPTYWAEIGNAPMAGPQPIAATSDLEDAGDYYEEDGGWDEPEPDYDYDPEIFE